MPYFSVLLIKCVLSVLLAGFPSNNVSLLGQNRASCFLVSHFSNVECHASLMGVRYLQDLWPMVRRILMDQDMLSYPNIFLQGI